MGIGVFATIAPFYGLFYDSQKRHFDAALDKVQADLGLSAYRSIVDVGCGTGALCSVLNRRGFIVTGVDPGAGHASVGTGEAGEPGNRVRAGQRHRADALRRLRASTSRLRPMWPTIEGARETPALHGDETDFEAPGHHCRLQRKPVGHDGYHRMAGGRRLFQFHREGEGRVGRDVRRGPHDSASTSATWYVCVPHPEVTGRAA